jgi:hypothetical protein
MHICSEKGSGTDLGGHLGGACGQKGTQTLVKEKDGRVGRHVGPHAVVLIYFLLPAPEQPRRGVRSVSITHNETEI